MHKLRLRKIAQGCRQRAGAPGPHACDPLRHLTAGRRRSHTEFGLFTSSLSLVGMARLTQNKHCNYKRRGRKGQKTAKCGRVNAKAAEKPLTAVSHKAAPFPSSESSGFAAKVPYCGKTRKLNFSRLIDSYFFHSICFLGMVTGVTLGAG